MKVRHLFLVVIIQPFLLFQPIYTYATPEDDTNIETIETTEEETIEIQDKEIDQEIEDDKDTIKEVQRDQSNVEIQEEDTVKDVQVEQRKTQEEKTSKKSETTKIPRASKFTKGDSGEHVREFKQKLVDLGFAPWSNPSPNYGAITANYVKDFQAYYGLDVTGIADDITRNKVDEVLYPPYRSGDVGKPVINLKKNLVKLGFATWKNPSPNYGSITASRVKDFQKAFNLEQTGIANQRTLDLLENPSYYVGDSGSHIRELKKDLVRLGFANWSDPSSNYGSITANVVKKFQRHYKLPVTGIAYRETREKIKEILNPPYRSGDIGQPVVDLKEKLVLLGFASWSNPSPNYGSITANVVKDFQKSAGLNADGIAGKETLKMLDQFIDDRKYRDGDSGPHVKKLKEDLVTLGFATWSNPSPNYGKHTSNRVKDFQRHYNLTVTGIADQTTRNKIKEIINPPYRSGDVGKPVVDLKEKLVLLGFASWSDPSPNYGKHTANRVKDFQRAYGLTVDGIAGPATLNKIENLLKQYENGDSGEHIRSFKKKLVKLGFANWTNPSPNYGQITANVVRDFQRHFGLKVTGVANQRTLSKVNEILSSRYQKGKRGNHVIRLKKDLNLFHMGFPSNPSNKYGNVTERRVKQFQKLYGLPESGIADEVTLKTIKDNIVKVFIDPGHGGSDPGATSGSLREKNLTLDIAKSIRNTLQKDYLGVDIKMSRTNDQYVSLLQRTNMANAWNADYFVSVHINSGGGTGFESFIHDKNATSTDKKYQNRVHDHIIRQINVRNRGKKQANFHVLRETNMPSTLFEYLFIDNLSDRQKLSSSSFRKRLGKHTADGIAKALNVRKK